MSDNTEIFKPTDCNSFKRLILTDTERKLLLHYLNPVNCSVLFENAIKYSVKKVDKTKDHYELQNKKNNKCKLMEHGINVYYGVSNVYSILVNDDKLYLNGAHVYCLLEFLNLLASSILEKNIEGKSRIEMNKPEYSNQYNENADKLKSREKDINSLRYLDSKIRYFIDYGSLKLIESCYSNLTLSAAKDTVSKRYKKEKK